MREDTGIPQDFFEHCRHSAMPMFAREMQRDPFGLTTLSVLHAGISSALKGRCVFVIAAPAAISGADSAGRELICSKWGERKAGSLLPPVLSAAPLAF